MHGSNRPLFSKWNGTPLPAAKPQLSSADQLRLVREFVARVGGMENARRAIEMLAVFKRAA